MDWSQLVALLFTSGAVGIFLKELFDIVKGKSSAARELNEWQVWAFVVRSIESKKGNLMEEWPPMPPERTKK